MLTVLALACSRSGLIVALRPRTGPDCSARASRRRLASAATFQTADTISPCRCPEVRGGVCASAVVVRMCACTLCWSSFVVCALCVNICCVRCVVQVVVSATAASPVGQLQDLTLVPGSLHGKARY